jgi:hypothetical protein
MTTTDSVRTPLEEIGPSQRLLPDNTQHSKRQTSMPPAEFKPTVLASERLQVTALDRAATEIGCKPLSNEEGVRLERNAACMGEKGIQNSGGEPKGRFSHSMPCPCRALIHTCHAAPRPCSDSAVSFVKVRVVAGKIRTASPTV